MAYIWNKIIEKLNSSNLLDRQISLYEESMLKKYEECIKKYVSVFEEKKCSLKWGLIWKNAMKDNISYHRGLFKRGYECYVYCVVEKNGKEVLIKSTDGEVEYYSLSTTWKITSICGLLKLKVEIYLNMDDVDEDMQYLVSQLLYIE